MCSSTKDYISVISLFFPSKNKTLHSPWRMDSSSIGKIKSFRKWWDENSSEENAAPSFLSTSVTRDGKLLCRLCTQAPPQNENCLWQTLEKGRGGRKIALQFYIKSSIFYEGMLCFLPDIQYLNLICVQILACCSVAAIFLKKFPCL